MRIIESKAGKGFKLQTLRAIELFLDAFDKYGKEAKIYVATEKTGDISLKVNGATHIGENKNYQNPHSINSEEIINTLANFVDIFVKAGTSADTLTFGFYSTSYIRPNDSFKLEFSILEYLATKKLEDNIIEIVKEKVIKYYEGIYKKDIDKVNQIKKLTIENWRIFLNKIDWKFIQGGNREISIAIKEKIMKLPLFAKYDYYNGIENAIVNEFRNKLEEQEEYNNFFTRYLNYDDFELIAKTEILNRVHDIQKNNFGEFKTISVAEIPREVNISQDRFFFIEEERKLIRKITNQLIYSKDKYLALLSGKPGQGKSVLCIQIGLEMEQRGYLVLFVELSADFTNIIERLKEIGGKHDNVVCIITKCHLHLSLLRKIYNNHSLYKNIKFLFESRIINKNHITEIDLGFLDDVRRYGLLFTERNIFEKYCGIAKLHAGKYPINRTLIKKIMKATGSNFVYLSELLKVIKPFEFESLEAINSNIIIQKVANQYIKNYNEDYKKLIDFAAINQYEIPFNCKDYVYEPWFKRLVSENLVVANIREYHYDFYHTDFARLLVKARFQPENRHEEIRFTRQIFLDYLLANDFNSIRVDEIFQRLYSNSAMQILEDLFINIKLKDKIINYYKESVYFEHPKPLCDLLTYINEFNLGDIKEYTKEIIVKNKNIGTLLSKDKTFVQSILKISFFLKLSRFPDNPNFIKNLDLDLKIISGNISFVTMCNYLSEAGKYDEPLLELMNQIFTENKLLDGVNREELLTLTEGLGSLYKVYSITNNYTS